MAIAYAKSTLSTTSDHGVIYKLTEGQAWDADDPIVKQRPHLFSDLPPRVRTSQGWVETATAVPGEKRRSGR